MSGRGLGGVGSVGGSGKPGKGAVSLLVYGSQKERSGEGIRILLVILKCRVVEIYIFCAARSSRHNALVSPDDQ